MFTRRSYFQSIRYMWNRTENSACVDLCKSPKIRFFSGYANVPPLNNDLYPATCLAVRCRLLLMTCNNNDHVTQRTCYHTKIVNDNTIDRWAVCKVILYSLTAICKKKDVCKLLMAKLPDNIISCAVQGLLLPKWHRSSTLSDPPTTQLVSNVFILSLLLWSPIFF